MVHDGQSKRKIGDIWAHLVLSAFTLLVPPLGMAAGVMYLSSPPPRGPEQQLAEPANMRPELAASQHLVTVERRTLDEGPAAFTQSQITKDPMGYKEPLQIETRPATAIANLDAKIPEQVPAASPEIRRGNSGRWCCRCRETSNRRRLGSE
jgi:hypothetical protein